MNGISSWALAGGAAVSLGFIGAFWSQVKAIATQLYSRWVYTVTISGTLQDAVSYYMKDNYKQSRFGHRAYMGYFTYVWKSRRKDLVAYEVVGSGGKLYWKGWAPIWLQRVARGESEASGGEFDDVMSITVFRGTVDIEGLIRDSSKGFNSVIRATSGRRFKVKHVTGSAGDDRDSRRPIAHDFSHDNKPSSHVELCNRPINYKVEDLYPGSLGERSLSRMCLDGQAEDVVRRINSWYASESWCLERGLPWKLGILLSGPPGTGKTSLTRAIAEDLDMPVFSYDLASIRNSELRKKWEAMGAESPCIALIEDIDSVFRGRENISKVKGSLTFDCLLNCIDGVARTDGILVVVTTNNPSSLDPALSCGEASRPGRIDIHLQMGAMDIDGRYKMANRILDGLDQAVIDDIVREGDGDMPSQFQERCIAAAYREFGGVSPVPA